MEWSHRWFWGNTALCILRKNSNDLHYQTHTLDCPLAIYKHETHLMDRSTTGWLFLFSYRQYWYFLFNWYLVDVCDVIYVWMIFLIQTLIFADGILMAGSMEALIQHLVPTDEYNPDVSLYSQLICTNKYQMIWYL